MPKPPLSMKPTGWFQVAWSEEVAVGQVHRMTYFGEDLVAWRGRSGQVVVMDAYCQHLGAHLGYGGTVVEDTIQCPFHGWQWNAQGRNTCIPYEDRPNIGKKIRTWPAAEANDGIYVWHDLERRDPFFELTDVFTSWADGRTAADYHPAYPGSSLLAAGVELHPQYVMENGVDFAHFKFVHQIPLVPIFTRHDFDQPISYVDFTVAFEGEHGSIEEVDSGVEAINCGLGLAITRSHGMVDNRVALTVTPVDDATCDLRVSVWIARDPDLDEEHSARRAARSARAVIEQVEADLVIWTHQRYADPAALARGEHAGFTALRAWAQQFYPATENATERTP